MPKFLIFKSDGTTTTREIFEKQFKKNLQFEDGWAKSFESLEACIKAWFI